MNLRIIATIFFATLATSGLVFAQGADSTVAELEALRNRLDTLASAHESDLFAIRVAFKEELQRIVRKLEQLQVSAKPVTRTFDLAKSDEAEEEQTAAALRQIAEQVHAAYFDPAAGEEATSEREIKGFMDFAGAAINDRFTGVAVDAIYTSEWSANFAGGLRRGQAYLDNVDLTVALDGGELFGWQGATLFLYVLGNNGGSPTDNIGDAQGASNIDTDDTWKLYEAWVQQQIFSDRISVLAGLYDLNGEFDVIETAGLFLNSSHGIGPDYAQTGRNGPSIFPNTSVGVRLRWQASTFYIQGAVLDGVAGDPDNPHGTQIKFGENDGLLIGAELAYVSGADDATQPYRKIAVGGHTYSSKFEALLVDERETVTPNLRARPGFYLLAEGSVAQEKADPAQGLAAFGRVGFADSRIYRFHAYTGAGLVYTGLFPGRDEDLLGLAIAAAYNGNDFKQSQQRNGLTVNNAEVTIEFTYRLQLAPWLAIQPDVQFIINPGTDSRLANALASGVRAEIAF